MPPRWYEVVLGCAAVFAGSIAGAAGFLLARRTGNRWGYAVSAGATLFVTGVAGQRSFPTADQVHRLGAAAQATFPGPWDAGIALPGLSVRVTPMALVGLAVGVIAVVVLRLRRPSAPAPGPSATRDAPELEDDDTA